MIFAWYLCHTPATAFRTPTQAYKGPSTSVPFSQTTTPDPGVYNQCPPPRRSVWVSFGFALLSFFPHAASFFVPFRWWFSTGFRKSPSVSSGRSVMTMPVMIPIQFVISLSSCTRCHRHLKSWSVHSNMNRHANRSSARVPLALNPHALVSRLGLAVTHVLCH